MTGVTQLDGHGHGVQGSIGWPELRPVVVAVSPYLRGDFTRLV